MPNPSPIELNLFKFSHLALRLSYPEDRLKEIHQQRKFKIHSFPIETIKSSGEIKKREIDAPLGEYKFLLKRINNRILNKLKLLDGICGAIIGKDLFDMVDIHCGREAILKIDLEDFYPNISSRNINSTLIRNKCSPDIARYLTELMTHNNILPQGFSTSPMISNLVAHNLDLEQLHICEQFDIGRTRWLDDIIFSGRRKDLELAAPKLLTAVKINGFRINKNKTRFSGRKEKLEVVGLITDKHKPYISQEVVEKVLMFIRIRKIESVFS